MMARSIRRAAQTGGEWDSVPAGNLEGMGIPPELAPEIATALRGEEIQHSTRLRNDPSEIAVLTPNRLLVLTVFPARYRPPADLPADLPPWEAARLSVQQLPVQIAPASCRVQAMAWVEVTEVGALGVNPVTGAATIILRGPGGEVRLTADSSTSSRQLQDLRARLADAVKGAALGNAGPGLAGELEKLVALKVEGSITNREYVAAKRKLLGLR